MNQNLIERHHLNEAQMQAVLHLNGPMLALAGPGSGKTTVITKRIENLIRNANVDPSNILVITFTKAAAREMKERFMKKMPMEGRRVTFGTFHAVFFMILKHAYGFDASNIVREEERNWHLRSAICAMALEYDDEAEFVQDVLSEISFVKNERVALDHYYPMSCGKDVFRDLFTGYQNFLRQSRKLDFDDMLVYAYELFAERKDILLAWQKKYRYLLIDEFQDVNQIQYDIVRLLVDRERNLFAVGDDDQSVYRFRGAKPEIMLHMPEDYKELKIVKLSYNYRCPKDVVEMAARVIGHNRGRFPKEVIAAKKDADSITLEVCETQREESRKVVERIRQSKAPFAQTAVLFRTNTQARILMEKLLEYNIPFLARDKTPNLYEHWIAKDMYAYLRIAEGGRKRSDFLAVMNRPKRYLSRESLAGEEISFRDWKAFYQKQPWIAERIQKMRADMETISGMRPFSALNYIRKAVGYDGFLEEYAKQRKIDVDGLLEVMDALQEGAKEFDSFADWLFYIERYKEELEEAYQKQKTEKNAVTLATYHSAKGLEFDVVHMIDVNEGVTPYKKAVLLPEMEEERRMFYVGVTRAKKALHLYVSKKINNHDMEVSRFLTEAGIWTGEAGKGRKRARGFQEKKGGRNGGGAF